MCRLSIPSTTTMLPRWLHPPSGSSSFLPRSPALVSLSPGRQRRHINVSHASASSESTPTTTSTPTPRPLAAFPIPNTHPQILQSVDFVSHPDVELEKHLGVNRNLDHDPNSPQLHNRNSDIDSHDPSSSHISSKKTLKHQSSDPGPPPPRRKDKGKKKAEIADREWEIRTGKLLV